MFQLSQVITKFEFTKQGWVLLLNDKHCCRIWLWFSSLTPLSTIVQLYHWRSVLLVEETGVPGENNRPATSH